jgi:hypothetical protein
MMNRRIIFIIIFKVSYRQTVVKAVDTLKYRKRKITQFKKSEING